MGLDFRQCDAHWGYIGFGRFRCKVFNAAGHNGDLYEMFRAGKTFSPSVTKDDLWPFLEHSDCDGELSVADMKKIEPRLRAIITLWPEEDYDRQHGLLLCDGMRACIDANEALEFC